MHINEQYHDLPLLETQTYQFIGREGEILTKEEQVLNEHLIDVYLNDQLTMKLICLPQHLTELVLGRLLTEHIIQSIDDVEQIVGQRCVDRHFAHGRLQARHLFAR